MGAMPEEVSQLLVRMEGLEIERRGMRDYCRGRLRGREVTLVFSRCGKVAAAATAATLVERYGVDLVVFTGVAGALDPGLRIGDVVVATTLVQHDLDASAIPGFRRFEVPLLGVAEFPAHPDLVDAASDAARTYLREVMPTEVPTSVMREFGIGEPEVRQGLVLSGDSFVAEPSTVAELRQVLPGALCVEMEGAAVAQVCFEHEVPLIVIRAISDRADHAAPLDFPRFVDAIASHLSAGIVGELLLRI